MQVLGTKVEYLASLNDHSNIKIEKSKIMALMHNSKQENSYAMTLSDYNILVLYTHLSG